MSQAGQQAAGAAVGAAIGAFAGGPAGAAAGMSIGAGIVGSIQGIVGSSQQSTIDDAALQLNITQARSKAAEQASVLASNFRKSLASQVAIAGMRGGAGSLVAQFGAESYQNYTEDKKSIEAGLAVSEASERIKTAENIADRNTRETKIASNLLSSTTNSINFNNLLKGRT